MFSCTEIIDLIEYIFTLLISMFLYPEKYSFKCIHFYGIFKMFRLYNTIIVF